MNRFKKIIVLLFIFIPTICSSQVEISLEQLRIMASHNIERLELMETTKKQAQLIDSLLMKCNYQDMLINQLEQQITHNLQQSRIIEVLYADSLQIKTLELSESKKALKKQRFKTFFYTTTGTIVGAGAGIVFAIIAIKE